MTTGSLTVQFEDPFWIGLFEIIDEQGLRVCKVTFGAEPTEKEVMKFVDKNWHHLQFSQAIDVVPITVNRKNPKRQLREAKKQMHSQGYDGNRKYIWSQRTLLCAQRYLSRPYDTVWWHLRRKSMWIYKGKTTVWN